MTCSYISMAHSLEGEQKLLIKYKQKYDNYDNNASVEETDQNDIKFNPNILIQYTIKT